MRGGEEAWHCEPFHAMSEFFADFGNYDVTLTVPDTHVVAATGMLVKARDNADATRTLTYRAEAVHDFVWMADPFMQTISGLARTSTGDVEVRVYFRPEQAEFAERHLAAGIGAIEQFSKTVRAVPVDAHEHHRSAAGGGRRRRHGVPDPGHHRAAIRCSCRRASTCPSS